MNSSRDSIDSKAKEFPKTLDSQKLIKEDSEFKEKVSSYQDELKMMEMEAIKAYKRRENEINMLVINEMQLKEIKNENEELKTKILQSDSLKLDLEKKIRIIQKKYTDSEANLRKVKEEQKLEYETQIKTLNKTIDSMKTTINQKENELMVKIEFYENEVKTLKNESQARIKKIELDFETNQKNLKNNFDTQFQQIKNENAQNLNYLIGQHVKAMETASISLEVEKVESKHKQALIANLKKEIVELKEKLNLLDENHVKEINELKLSLTTDRAIIMANEMLISQLEKDYTELNEKSFLLNNLNQSMNNSIQKEKSLNAANEKLLNHIKNQKIELENQISMVKKELESTTESYQTKEIEMLKKLFNEKKSKHETEKELNSLKSQNQELNSKVTLMEKEINELKSSINKYQDEKKQQNLLKVDLDQKCAQLKKNLDNLEDDKKKNSPQQSETAKVANLNKTIEKLEKEIVDIKEFYIEINNQHIEEINRLRTEYNQEQHLKRKLDTFLTENNPQAQLNNSFYDQDHNDYKEFKDDFKKFRNVQIDTSKDCTKNENYSRNYSTEICCSPSQTKSLCHKCSVYYRIQPLIDNKNEQENNNFNHQNIKFEYDFTYNNIQINSNNCGSSTNKCDLRHVTKNLLSRISMPDDKRRYNSRGATKKPRRVHYKNNY